MALALALAITIAIAIALPLPPYSQTKGGLAAQLLSSDASKTRISSPRGVVVPSSGLGRDHDLADRLDRMHAMQVRGWRGGGGFGRGLGVYFIWSILTHVHAPPLSPLALRTIGLPGTSRRCGSTASARV